jgi:hypothetical protein
MQHIINLTELADSLHLRVTSQADEIKRLRDDLSGMEDVSDMYEDENVGMDDEHGKGNDT